MKTIASLAVGIGLLYTCIACCAYAQTRVESSPGAAKVEPAYVVAEIPSPSITITKSAKDESIVYEKKTPAAPSRVLLGVQYNSRNAKTGKSGKSDVVMAKDVVTLSQPKGIIPVATAEAFASFMLSAARVSEGGQVDSPDLIEVRLALFAVGAGVDAEQNPKYGKQVSNSVLVSWKP